MFQTKRDNRADIQPTAEDLAVLDTSYLVELAVKETCRKLSYDKELAGSDRLDALDAVLAVVNSGYGTREDGSRDLYDIVLASIAVASCRRSAL